MSTLKEFKEKVLSQENPFLLNDGYGKTLCVKVPIGQAEYIYTMREYLDGKDIVTDIYEKMDMTAILKAGKIYMIKPYNVMDRCDEEYPENVYYVNDEFREKISDQIKEKVIDKLYDELPIVELSKGEKYDCEKEVRLILTYKKDLNDYIAHRQNANIETINSQKFADDLCGVADLEEEAKGNFESKKEMWIKLKSSLARIKELVITEPETVMERYELDIIEGLHSVEAKTVQVEFLYNGKTAIGKVDKNVILKILSTNDYFSDYNFTTMKSGEKIIQELGAGKWKTDSREVLTCKYINKITYGKKVLYQRTEE